MYHNRHATAGSGTLVGTTARNEVIDVLGFDGVALLYYSIQFDANCAAADTVLPTVQKCTSTAGANATSLAALSAAVAGDGAAKTYRGVLAVPLYALGEYATGTPYRYLRLSIAITDADSSGTFDIAAVLMLPGKHKLPVTQTAEES